MMHANGTLDASPGNPVRIDLQPSVRPRLENDLLLRACRREATERVPVWIMRQAGRYLPEYRAVRARADFLTMVRTPELATEVTLQPIDLIGVDAAIIFSDILVIPSAMGMTLQVEEGVGPRFDDPVRTAQDAGRLRDVDIDESLGYVLDALRMTRRALQGRVPLIGFAGAPWTLLAYMVEGGGTQHYAVVKRMLMQQPALAHQLLERLADVCGRFLCAQIDAGADVVQLFDSAAVGLGPREYREFALPYMGHAARIARARGAPVIAFAPGAGWAIAELAEATQADVLGIDWRTTPEAATTVARRAEVALQGNLDPCTLYAPPAVVRARTIEMLDAFGGHGHIANLGHGVLPDMPVASVKAFVETVKEWVPAPQR